MKIETIELKWFRGAASSTKIDLGGKNIVIYGSNGSGKSSFVDAFEYLIQNGRIKHLSHEFSGRKQEKGIRNTHTPANTNSEIIINFNNSKSINIKIQENGTSQITSDPDDLCNLIQKLNKQGVILRQDELSEFICSQKGEKYSTLLPLLGLDTFENAAQNINSIISTLKKETKIDELKNQYNVFENAISKIGLTVDNNNYKNLVIDIAKRYIAKEVIHVENVNIELLKTIQSCIENSISKKEPEQELLIFLNQIKEIEILNKYTQYKENHINTRDKINTTIETQINTLEQSEIYLKEIEGTGRIKCPVCGTEFAKDSLASHVSEELAKLNEIRIANNKLKESKAKFTFALSSLKTICQKDAVKKWLSIESQTEIKNSIDQLLCYFSIKDKEEFKEEDFLINLDKPIGEIITRIEEETKKIPPSTQQLIIDKNSIDLMIQIPEFQNIGAEISKVENLLHILELLESNTRIKIQAETKSTIAQITSEIQSIWDILHPSDSINEILLYIPDDTDRAIDISLKFWGKDQPSPRNTLSEGHRNSLGLSIFLALSKKTISECEFIILDDIVSSIDIDHRSKIADVLLSKFNDKQILIFTHDRYWYRELKYRLDSSNWIFLTLKPWVSPEEGIIVFNNDQFTFEDVLQTNQDHPNLAGNQIRQIMDVELAIISEELKIQVEYLRGDKNDKRLCIEFLDRLISKGEKSFYKKDLATSKYELFKTPINYWQDCKKLLLAFANSASHGEEISPKTIIQLKESCEKVLLSFTCESCGKHIFYANHNDNLQCNCGLYKWVT